jgi:hypothetical protein
VIRFGTSVLLVLLVAGLLLVSSTATPAATPGAVATGSGQAWKPDARDARAYARSRAGRASFAVIGLDGRIRKFRASETAPLASVFKTMLLVAYLREKGVRRDRLSDHERGLLGPMIRRSDNVAATEVNRLVGADGIKRVARKAGIGSFSYDPNVWGMSRASPQELVRFIRRIEDYVPRRHRAYAMRVLASVKGSQRWGVGEVKPRGWDLYFKGGWGSGSGAVNHQIALLERGKCKVALALFTTNSPSHDYASRTLAGLAGSAHRRSQA